MIPALDTGHEAGLPRHFDESYAENLVLRDGTPVTLRRIRRSDKELVLDVFERMSPESRRRRFFHYKHKLTQNELAYLTEVDGEDHFALVAIRHLPTGLEQGFGTARFIRLPAYPLIAEPAIAVVDEIHGQGLGHALLTRLMAAARERGIERFRFEIMLNNSAMLQLLGQLAPQAERHVEGDVVAVDCELPRRPWDPEAAKRPRGRLLHRLLSLGGEGGLRLKRRPDS